MWEQLAEETFFYQYHMHLPMRETMSLTIPMRKFMIEKFIEQKQKENEAAESARRKAAAQSKR